MDSSIHLYRRLEYLDSPDVWSTRAWHGTPYRSARSWERTSVLYGLTLRMLMAQFLMHWLSLQWSSCGFQRKWGISSCSTTVPYAVYNQPVHNIMAELRCWDTNGLRNFFYPICAGNGDHHQSSGKSWTRCIVEGCRRTSSYKSIYGWSYTPKSKHWGSWDNLE